VVNQTHINSIFTLIVIYHILSHLVYIRYTIRPKTESITYTASITYIQVEGQ
jgi:hypothetical protein